MTLHAWTEARWNPFAIRWQRHSAGAAFIRLRCTLTSRGHQLPPFEYDGPSPGQAVAEARFGGTPLSDLIPLEQLTPIGRTVFAADAASDYQALRQLFEDRPALLCYAQRVVTLVDERALLSTVAEPFGPAVEPDDWPPLRAHTVSRPEHLVAALDILTGPLGQHFLLVGGAIPDDLSELAALIAAMNAGIGFAYDRLAALLTGGTTLLFASVPVGDGPATITRLGSPAAVRSELDGASLVSDAGGLPSVAPRQHLEAQVGDVVSVGIDSDRLDLSGEGVLSLTDLPTYARTRTLILDSRLVLDFEAVAGVLDLRSVSLRGVKVNDLDPLRSLAWLEELAIDRIPFAGFDLDGLDSLRCLDLGALPIGTLEQLRSVPRLGELVIDNGSRAPLDLSPLGNVPQLTRLVVRTAGVTDIGPISTLTSLTTLDISGTRPTSLTALVPLLQLEHLSLIGVAGDLGPIAGLRHLRTLDLDQTDLDDLSRIEPLRELESLGLSYTPVSDLRPLLELPALRRVDLTGTDTDDSQLSGSGIRIERRR